LLAAIFAGGCAGTLARAGLAEALPHDPGHWPWATFAVNVAGAFLLGAVMAWLAVSAAPESPRLRYVGPLLGTGFCGALTTFSTMQLELLRMIDRGEWALAGAYAAVSVAVGLAAVLAAMALVRGVRGTRGPRPA
jgi:CrcB protein